MTLESRDTAYNQALWRFAKAYCHRYTIKAFAKLTRIPINTLSRNLKSDEDDSDFVGTFAEPTFNSVAKWAREFEKERLAKDIPVELDGFLLPRRPGQEGTEESPDEASEAAETETASAEIPGNTEEIPSTDPQSDDTGNADGNGVGNGITDGTGIVVPAGVSITLPELRGRALEIWNVPAFFREGLTSEDLERTFGISLMMAADTRDHYAGWVGPSLPDGVTLTSEMHDEIALLAQDWLRYAYAYDICERVENLKRQYAFRYILRGKLELEVRLIGKCRMTHPSSEAEWQGLQRRREIRWRGERIAELKDVENPSLQELLVFGTIKVVKTAWTAISRAATWSLGRIFRRP